MEINLWFFLTVSSIFGVSFAIIAVIQTQKTKMKQLEIEALKIQQATLKAEVDDAVNTKLAAYLERIETLEAIVTDKSYDLNEKITKLK